MFPEISNEDKEKISMIIQDLLYEENVWEEINTINGETNNEDLANEDFTESYRSANASPNVK